MSSNQTVTEQVAIAAASMGGLALLLVLGILASSFIIIGKIPWYSICFGFLCFTILFGFITSSVLYGIKDPKAIEGLIISQTVLNGLAIVLLGVLANFYINTSSKDASMYVLCMLPVTLILSIISVSSTIMTKLSIPPSP